jgi:hypothetical protein
VIRAPLSQKHYREHFNAVDINDRDSADYSTSIRTNRYYIRMLCWSLDRVIHACYVVVCECAKAGVGPSDWKRYLSKHNGRHDFQIHLAIELMNRAISLDWKDKPDWMRKSSYVPCDCKLCYFCKNGHTGGICSPRKKECMVQYKCGKRVRQSGCSEIRMKILNYSDYCHMCYAKQPDVKPNGEPNTWEEKKANCKRSTMGCVACEEPICKGCWPSYDHGISA